MRRLFLAACVSMAICGAVILDRVAIVVNNQPIKDSDIERDIRATSLLNGVQLDLGPAARIEAANRLIDQALIRREIQVAQYPEAKPEEAQALVEEMRKQRYGQSGAYQAALQRYGIDDAQLHHQVAWQATVLKFIEQRFRPGVLISDEEVQKYFDAHVGELRRQAGGKPVTVDDVRGSIEEQLSGERVNRDFFAWLEQAHKEAQIRYLEADLK